MPELKTNIIVPVCGKKDYTEQMIKDVFAKTSPERYWELTIVDNGSTDGTHKLPCLKWDGVRYIRLDDNYGFGAACNYGAQKHAEEESHMLFLNNDVRLPENWLTRMLYHFADPKVGIVGPRTNHSASLQRIPLHDPKEEWKEKDAELQLTSLRSCFKVPVITGFCMLVRQEVWREIGFFDANSFLLSGEDYDYCIRAREEGYDVVVAEGVYIFHYGHITCKDLPGNGNNFWRAGADMLRKKWGPDFLKMNRS